jgi:hypothetical protein
VAGALAVLLGPCAWLVVIGDPSLEMLPGFYLWLAGMVLLTLSGAGLSWQRGASLSPRWPER